MKVLKTKNTETKALKYKGGGGEVRTEESEQEQFWCNCSPVPDTYC